MKTTHLLALLLTFGSVLHAAQPAPAVVDPEKVPEGLTKSDWTSIRAAYEAGRHAFQPVEGGWQARNPGQQWTTRFDQRGFEATPQGGGWTWGLELQSYGFGEKQTPVSGTPEVKAQGQRLSYQWDATVQEWFVNDQRGLEHGFTIGQRPDGISNHKSQISDPLSFTLTTRGGLRPKVSADGVQFQDASGAAVLNYTGLKVWDADGKILPARFMPVGRSSFRILVDESAARYPITIDPVAQQAYLKASNAGESDFFGYAVALSGDTAVVGAWAESSNATTVNGAGNNDSAHLSGAAYVFIRSGGTWSQQAYLKANNSGADDNFGTSVAVSGNTIVIGAPQEDSNATTVNGLGSNNSAAGSGAAYVFTRSGGTWTQQAYLKASNSQAGANFGGTVAVSGDTAVIGAPIESGIAADSGAAYVFTRSGSTWTQQAYLKADNADAYDNFGVSVAVDGDTAVIGTPFESSDATVVNGNGSNNDAEASGAAYVFTRSGGTWSQQAYLKANNSGAFDYFGASVSLSGGTVVVGAPFESSDATTVNGDGANNSRNYAGAAYVFTASSGIWTQQAYLKASNSGLSDQFGYSVAVSGDTAVIGAIGEASNGTTVNGDGSNNSAPESGAAYIFTRSGSTWSQQSYLKANNSEAGDQFGLSVAVSGDTAVIGATGESSNATTVNGNGSNNSASDSGAAYVFTGLGPAVAPPTVTNVSPASGTTAGGTSVTITGTGFASGATVTIGGSTVGSVGVSSATQITCVTPAGAAGTASVLVTTPGGTNAANTLFTYLAAPSAPTIGTATAGNASASVTFTAPASNGGSAITGYTVTSSPGGITATGSASPINVTGLTNGTLYTFTVTATNIIGTGAASSASNSVTPMASSDIPLTLGTGTLTIDATGAPGAAQTSVSIVDLGGGVFVIEIKDLTRTIGAPAGGTQVDSHTVRIPIGSVSNIVINGTPLADTFTLDLSLGALPGLVTVNGNLPSTSPGDSLRVIGAYDDITYGPNGIGSGNLDVDGTLVAFTGLEPLDFSGASVVDLTVQVDPTSAIAGDVITTIAAVDAGVNTEITFADATGVPNGLESIKFGALTGTFTIEGDNAANDFFALQGLGSAMAGHVSIDGLGGNADVIQVYNATFAVTGANKDLSLKADFIGLTQTLSADTTPDDPGILRATGNITLAADGDDTVTTPPLWGTSGVWGTTLPSFYNATTFATRGNILNMGHIEKAAGSDATLTLRANRNVMILLAGASGSTGGRIVSTTNKLHTIFNSDRDALNGGAVNITTFAQVLTNGGDLTIGGGANPATTPATGITGAGLGASIQGATVNSGGGNISIRGTGGPGNNSVGVLVNSSALKNSTLISSGAGNISIVGVGGNATTGTHGIRLFGDLSVAVTTATPGFVTVESTTGSITLNGTSVQSTPNGVQLFTNSRVSSTSGGTVSITAVTAGTTALALTPAISVGPPAQTGTAEINSTNGQVIIAADTMNLNGGAGTESITAGTGTVTLKPTTAGKSIALGSGVTDSGTQLAIDSSTELPNVTAATVAIGAAASGTLTVSSVISPATFTTLALASGSGTTFNATSGFTADVTTASNFEKITVVGTVSITAGSALTLNSAGGYVWNGTDTFVFLANDLADAITGTFTGPTLTNFLGSALTATESYTAGTGNDFVVGQAAPTVTSSTATLASNATTLIITGTGFDTTPGNNLVTLSNGALGTVTAATATQLTVTFSTQPTTVGGLTAIVSTLSGSSGAAVQVATVSNIIATLTGGALTITDDANGNDTLSLSESAGNLVIGANVGCVIGSNAGTGSGTNSVSIPLSSITGTITVNAAGGTDTINVGTFATALNGLVINGDGEADTVNLNGDVTFTAGASVSVTSESLTVAANADITTSGAGTIMISADDIAIAGTGTLVSASTVNLKPQTAARAIDLGTNTAGQLGLTDTELDRVTAGTLVVGDAASGQITLSAAISPAGTTTLSLITGAGVTQASTAAKITETNLAVRAVGSVSMDQGSSGRHSISTLAARSTGGGIGLRSGVALTVGTVDGLSGLDAGAGGALAYAENGDLLIQQPIVATGGAFLHAWATGALLNISADVTSGGSVLLGGDRMIINNPVAATSDCSVFGADTLDLGSATDVAAATTELSDAELDFITISTPGGLLTLQTNGNIVVSAALTLGSKTPRLSTAVGTIDFNGGSITTTSDVSLYGEFVTADASGTDVTANKILSFAKTFGTAANPLRTAVANLSIDQFQGGGGARTGIYILEADSVSLTNNGLKSTNAPISLTTSAGSVTLSFADVATTGTVSLITGGAGGTLNVGSRTISGSAVSLIADNMTIGATAAISASSGAVSLAPLTPGRPIDLGTNTALQLGLTDAELDRVTASTLVIGDANSGAITISAAISPVGYSLLDIQKGVTFSAAGGFDSDVTSATVYEKIKANGAVVINAASTLTATALGGFVPAALDTFTLIDNVSASTTTGNFTGKPQGTIVAVGGVDRAISYTGGTGNDVVLQPPPPTVTVLTPSTGSTLGNDTVTITGTNFAGVSIVTFGGIAAPLTANTNTSLQVTTPPHAAGQASVVVTTPGGTNAVPIFFEYVAPNTAPTITSNGGGATASINVLENTTAVTTVVATDTDLPAQTITYSKSGTHAGLFTIDGGTGVLTFAAAPDFETGPGPFSVTVTATDNGSPNLNDSQVLTINVTDVNETAPAGTDKTITLNEGATYTFVPADFGFTDPLSSPANNFKTLHITTLPSAGTLSVGGVPAVVGDTVTPSTAQAGATLVERTNSVPQGDGSGFTSIIGSGDGMKLAALSHNGYMRFSADGGANWVTRNAILLSSEAWAMSHDGSRMIVVSPTGYLNVSTDDGQSWTQLTNAGSRNWQQVVISGNGQHIAASVQNGYIHTSTDGGSTWTQQTGSGTSYIWTSLVASDDGMRLTAGRYTSANVHQPLLTSTDGGVTWAQPSPLIRDWRHLACSADGMKLVTGAPSPVSHIFTSVDGGANWTERTSSSNTVNWQAIASSSDGMRLFALGGQMLHTSSDGGATWTTKALNAAPNVIFLPYSFAVSSDGTRLAIADYSPMTGKIWTSVGASSTTPTLTYTAPSVSADATPLTNFTFQVEDDGSTANGGQVLDLSPNTISINVINLNTAPTDIALTPASITENSTANTTVGTLSSTDADVGDTHTYTLVTGTGDTDNAAFNISGNALRLTGSADYETRSSYSVRVRTADAEGLFYEEAFTVTVLNLVENVTVGFHTASGLVGNYYNGGTDAAGNSGPNVGVAFPNSTAGGGKIGEQALVNVPDGFAGGFSCNHINVAVGFNLDVWSGLNGTGTQLAHVGYNLNGDGVASATFSGIAKSVTLGKYSGSPSYDNFTFGSTTVGTPVAEPPGVTTSAATLVSPGSARLNATVNPGGAVTTAQFEYGTSVAYGSTASITLSPNDGITGQVVSANLTGLLPNTTYYFRVTGTNSVGSRNGAGLTFATPVNNAPTNIALSAATVTENNTAGATIGTLTTTDADTNDTHTYSLVSGTGSSDNAAFTITGNTLTINGSADYETKSSYSIRVRSTDSGALTFEKQFTVSVLPVNEFAPTAINGPILIMEDFDYGASGGSLTGTNGGIGFADAWTGGTYAATGLTFSSLASPGGAWSGSSGSRNFSSVLAASGPISGDFLFKRPVSAGAVQMFGLGGSNNQGYTVALAPLNDGNGGTVPQVSIQGGPGFTNVVPSPLDPNTTYMYRFSYASGSITVWILTAAQYDNFAVGGVLDQTAMNAAAIGSGASEVTGRTTIPANVTSNIANLFTYTFQGSGVVMDRLRMSATPAASALSVLENAAVNSTVGTLNATDADVGDTFIYTLVTGAGDTDNASFNISGSTLRTNAVLSYEAGATRSIRVRVQDSGGLSYEQQLTVNVTNVNETPTDIALSNNTTPENVAANTTIGTLSSTDPDAGNTFTYTLVSGAGSTDNASFNILGNALRITNPPNFEAKSSYSVRVRTTDQGGLAFDKAFTISITDLNEAPTSITVTPSSLAENNAVGASAGTLTAGDPDAGSSHTFALVTGTGDTDNGSFALAANGVLTINVATNFEGKSIYSIRVRATDNGSPGLTYEQAVTVNITNVNEAPTDIALSNASVVENAPQFTVIGTLSRTDPDAGDTALYNMAGTGNDNLKFFLSGNTLYSFDPLDFETRSTYTVGLRISDSGGLFFDKAFTITVTNKNETPSFTVGAAQRLPSGTSAAQTVSGFISAYDDGDSTVTQALTFNVSNNNNALFSVQPAISSTGQLSYTPSGTSGVATVSVSLTDDNTINGNAALTTGLQTFTITVDPTPDYTVTTTSTTVTVTNISNTGDTLSFTDGGAFATFAATGRTFSLNGGVNQTGSIDLTYASLPGITSIIINAAGGNDTVSIGNFSAVSSFPGLTINGGTGDDTVSFTGDITFAADASLDVDLQNDDATPGIDSVSVATNANLLTSGTGTITVKVSKNVAMAAGSSLEVGNGNLTVEANVAGTAVGNLPGVSLAGATLTSSGSGTISVSAQGGDDGATSSHYGINLTAGAVIASAGTGGVTLTGTGGSGTSGNYGVRLSGSNVVVSSVSGPIQITGTGGTATTTTNSGIIVTAAAKVIATNAATITLNGTGGTGTQTIRGVEISSTGTQVTTVDGNLAITGVGGATATADAGTGVAVLGAARVSSSGIGLIDIDGKGATGTSSANGVEVSGGSSLVTSINGNITVRGRAHSAATGGSNYGVFVRGGGKVTSTGTGPTAATITIDGTGGGGTGDDTGAFVGGIAGAASSIDGNVVITGVAGAGSLASGSYGVGIGYPGGAVGSIVLTGLATLDVVTDTLRIVDTTGSITTGTGGVTLRPKTPGRTIGIGAADSASSLGITDAELDVITTSLLTIGNSASGNITVSAAISPANVATLNLVSGGTIADTNTSGTDITVAALTTSGQLAPGASPGTFSTSGTHSFVGGSSFNVEIGGVTAGTQHDQLSAGGSVTIPANVTLSVSSFGGFTPSIGQVFTIVSRTGGTGTFAGLAEGSSVSTNFLGSGLPARISYVGGDGDDVIIRVANPEISITGYSNEISDGDTTPRFEDGTDFGGILTYGGSVPRVFRIVNSGTSPLSLTGTPKIVLSDTVNFSVGLDPVSPVAPTQNTLFQLRFDPVSPGVKTCTVSIDNDDLDENPYTFVITGEGQVPEPVEFTVGGLPRNVVTNEVATDAAGLGDGTQFDVLGRGGYLANNGTLGVPGTLKIGVGGVTETPNNFQGYWKSDGTILRRLMRSSDAAPGTGGALFNAIPTIPVPGLNPDGEVTILAALRPGSGSPAVTASDDVGMWSEVGGNGLQLLMRENDAVPGIAGAFVSNFGFGCYATATLGGGTGEAAFTAKLRGSTTDSVLLRMSITGPGTASVSVVAREQTAAIGTTEQFGPMHSTFSSAVRMDPDGNIVFGAVTRPSNKTGIWFQPLGDSLTKIFAAGDVAPDTGGATFAALDMPSMASSGSFTFRGVLNRDGDNVANDKNDGIWFRSDTGFIFPIIRRGDSTVTGLPAGGKVGNVWNGWVNLAGEGAWRGWVDTAGDGISPFPADTYGIYTNMGSDMILLISVGDDAPGVAGAKFSFMDHPVVGGDSTFDGFLAFLGNVTGGGVTAGTNDKGVWASHNGEAPVLVLRTGDEMPTSQGSKTVANIDFPGSNMDIRPWQQSVMDNKGRLLVIVTFTDGTTSQVIIPVFSPVTPPL